MFDRIFANYLVSKQVLGPECLKEIYKHQEAKRVRLGVIAVSEKLLTEEQADEINRLQSETDKRFGDIAVERGYLTESQVSRLLTLQGNSFLAFVQSAVDLKYLKMNDVVDMLNTYQQENGYTLTDIENLKSCDIDRIVPIYVYDLKEGFACDIIGIAARAISRLVDYHMYIERPYISDKLITENLCHQASCGDFNILLAMSGAEESMMKTAVGFSGEQYIDDFEDALDAICELINCINGLFATEMSKRSIEIDMNAPSYRSGKGVINSEEIINLPVYIFDKMVTFSIIMSDNYTIE
ncbi:MAG: chemotaxis protein CheX [Lachnospiraceae bacterium]|nr:chemotaxis protein CheX [Lachnospiraceae bacterium]